MPEPNRRTANDRADRRQEPRRCLVLGPVSAHWEAKIKRVVTVLRFVVVFVCVFALSSVGVSAQGDSEKTWDDAVQYFDHVLSGDSFLPEGAISRLGDGWVNDLSFSPDGQILAVATSVGIELRDGSTLDSLGALRWSALGGAGCCTFSPSGNLLAAGLSDGTVAIWDAESWKCRYVLRASESGKRIVSVCFSGDGVSLLTGSLGGELCLFDAVSGTPLRSLPEQPGFMLWAATMSPDGRYVASAAFGAQDEVRVWDLERDRARWIPGSSGRTLVFTPDSRFLISTHHEDIQIWNLATRELESTLAGHERDVFQARLSSDGSMIASGSFDGTVRVWDVQHAAPSGLFVVGQRLAQAVAFHPSGRTLAVASQDHTLRLLETSTCTEQLLAGGVHTSGVASIAFSPDGELLAAGYDEDNEVRIWEVQPGRLMTTFPSGVQEKISSVAFSPDGALVAYGGLMGRLEVWEVSNGALLARLVGHSGGVVGVEFAPDGLEIVSVHGSPRDKAIRVWSTVTWEELACHVLPEGGMPISRSCMSPEGDAVAFADSSYPSIPVITLGSQQVDSDPSIHVFSLESQQVEWSFTLPASVTARSLSWSSFSSSILVAASAHGIYLIRTGSQEPMQLEHLIGYSEDAICVAAHPSAPLAAVGYEDGVLELWDIASREVICRAKGRGNSIDCLAFDGDGSSLASGSDDGTIVVWDVNRLLDLGVQVTGTHHEPESTSSQDEASHADAVPLGSLLIYSETLHVTEDYPMIQAAIEYYEQTLAIFREVGDRAGEAVSLHNLGARYYSLYDYQQAIEHYEQALSIFREIRDQADEAASLNNLGLCYQSLSDYQQAIDYHEQSLAIDREIGDQAGEAASLNNLGLCYQSLSDYQQAIDYHEQSLAICLEIRDRAGEASSLNNLGVCYESLSDYPRAFEYYERSLPIFREIGDQDAEAKSLNNFGNYYYRLAEHRRAIDYHEQSLAIRREIYDRAGEAASLNNLANCHYSLSEYQRSIEYWEQALPIFREIGDRAGEARSLNNLGACYELLADYQRAIDAAQPRDTVYTEAGEADYPTIQAAIDAAQPGDTVYIGAGTYRESLVIDKPLSLVGDDRRTTMIRSSDSEQHVITVKLPQGNVNIAGIRVRGGNLGVLVNVDAGAQVTLDDVIVSETQCGVAAFGDGKLVVTESYFVDAGSPALQLSNTTVVMTSNEIILGGAGVVLGGAVDATLDSNLIGLCHKGIETYTTECGWVTGAKSFSGTVAGTANRVYALSLDLCPGYPGEPWPEGFIDQAWRDPIRRAIDAVNRSMTLYNNQDYHVAAEVCSTGMAGLKDAPFPLVEAHFRQNMGLVYGEFGEYGEALAQYEAARTVYVDRGMDIDAAKTDENIGSVYVELGRYEEALAAYQSVRAVYFERDMDVDVAETDQNIGIAYGGLERYEDALDAYERARAVLLAYGMEVSIAEVDLNIGNVYIKLGRYEEALTKYEVARTVYVEQEMTVSVAKIDHNIGAVFSDLGQYEQALDAYEQARAVSLAHGMEVTAAKIELSIGIVYSRLGWYDEALEAYRAARAVFLEQGMPVDIARVDVNISIIYVGLGRREAALDAYEEARAVFLAYGMEVTVAKVDVSIGVVYANLGRYEEALTKYEEARAVFLEQEMGADVVRVDHNIGSVYGRLGQCEEALAKYEAALELLGSIAPVEGATFSHPAIRWEIYTSKGIVHEEVEEWADARTSYEDAIMLIESIRGGFTSEELKLAWQERTKDVYERLINLLYRMGQGASAFQYVERCRARTFLDLVAIGPVGTLENIVEDGIRSGVVEASVIGVDLAEVVAGLPAGTAALEYFVTENATYVWVVTDGEASEPIRIEVSRSELRDQVLAFRTTIETTSAKMSEIPNPEEGMEAMSRDLYELLIAPVQRQLDGIDHLVIVPSGPLYYLPFSALIDCPGCEEAAFLGGEYLVDRYALSYAPSLTTLKYAWASSEGVHTDPLFLALADPDSGDPQFSRLGCAQDEAEAVAALFDPGEVYLDAAATEEVVTARASSADQILLSTHGSFNPLNPMSSYLLLSPTEESDGRLYTHEIFSLDLHTSLVTLSACETLLPALKDAEDQVRAIRGEPEEEDVELDERLLETLTSGDEIVGLTRAFIYAGTPSVLSSLWQVTSLPTQWLMVAFYTHLASGLDKAQALRQAQLDVKASCPHPCYWAAFELVGDWR